MKKFVRDLKDKDNSTVKQYWKELKANLFENSDATKAYLNEIGSNNQATSQDSDRRNINSNETGSNNQATSKDSDAK